MELCNKYFIFSSLLSLLMISCTNTRPLDVDDIEKIQTQSMYCGHDLFMGMTYKYVKLQTLNECLITSIAQVKRDDSLLFVMDSKEHIFLFDLEGNYLRTIGEKGNSNSEYIMMSTFFLDKDKQHVGIIDKAKSDYLLFDYKGTFIHRKPLPRAAIRFANNCELLGSSLILSNDLNQKHAFNYTVVDLESNTYADELPFLITAEDVIFGGDGLLCNLDDRLLCRAQYSDTLYEYSNAGFHPVYELVTSQPHCTSSDLKKVPDEYLYLIGVLHKKLNKSIGVTRLYATQRKLFFSYMEDGERKRAIFDINSKKLYVEGFNDCRHNIIYSDSKCFIGSVKIKEYLEHRDSISVPEELKSLIDISGDLDNPILILIEDNE